MINAYRRYIFEEKRSENMMQNEEKKRKEITTAIDSKSKAEKKPHKISTQRLAVNLIVKINAAVLITVLALVFVLGINIHYGNNMHPAVNDGDLVISLKLQRPYLNAAVLYKSGKKKNVGRVVGLPGNMVEINSSGQLLVNGMVAAEDIYYPTYPSEQSGIEYPYIVDEGKVFILNDFREDVNDSRTFGAVDAKDIDGPIIFSFRRRGF